MDDPDRDLTVAGIGRPLCWVCGVCVGLLALLLVVIGLLVV